jgi:hypothetical protein
MTGRWTYRTSGAGVIVLAAAAFTLSYDALHQLALDSRVRPALAWLWPVVIDGTIVVALLILQPEIVTWLVGGQGRGADEGGHRRSWRCANNQRSDGGHRPQPRG